MPKSRVKLTEDEITILREKYGIPNWRNKKEYDYISSLTLAQLRWEFLRRKISYREKWQEHKSLLFKPINPAENAELFPKDFAFKDTVYQGDILPFVKEHTGTWLSDEMSNEEYNEACSDVGAKLIDLCEEHFVVIGFDPFSPINPQIDKAKLILKEAREQAKRKFSRRTITYRNDEPSIAQAKLLRLLDAYTEGATLCDIGKIVYGIDDYNAANTEVNKNYKIAKSYFPNR